MKGGYRGRALLQLFATSCNSVSDRILPLLLIHLPVDGTEKQLVMA